jgi:predicted nucleotidyltransferase
LIGTGHPETEYDEGNVRKPGHSKPDPYPFPDRKVKSVHDHTRIIAMDALALLREHEPILKKRFGVAKIGIFGSFVRGEERPESDVDVLVTFRKGEETFDHYMDCKFYLEDLFGRNVDLVMKGAIKPRLREYILGEVVYA